MDDLDENSFRGVGKNLTGNGYKRKCKGNHHDTCIMELCPEYVKNFHNSGVNDNSPIKKGKRLDQTHFTKYLSIG